MRLCDTKLRRSNHHHHDHAVSVKMHVTASRRQVFDHSQPLCGESRCVKCALEVHDSHQ